MGAVLVWNVDGAPGFAFNPASINWRIDCIKSMPPGATGDEKVRRLCLAIGGHSRAAIDAMIAQERRASFRVV